MCLDLGRSIASWLAAWCWISGRGHIKSTRGRLYLKPRWGLTCERAGPRRRCVTKSVSFIVTRVQTAASACANLASNHILQMDALGTAALPTRQLGGFDLLVLDSYNSSFHGVCGAPSADMARPGTETNGLCPSICIGCTAGHVHIKVPGRALCFISMALIVHVYNLPSIRCRQPLANDVSSRGQVADTS